MKNTNKHIVESKNSFTIPKDYFESIEKSVFEKLDKNKILKKDFFIVPGSYFDSIENSVIEKINSTTKVISFKSVLLKYIIPIGIAASFILFSSIFFFKNNKINFNQLTDADIEIWLDNNIEGVNTYTIDNVYNDITFDELSVFTDDELINYLEETDFEILELIN